MAKTIKVIDLLNKIANGEEVPEKIKYEDNIYTYFKKTEDYINYADEDEWYGQTLLFAVMLNHKINEILDAKVEIIEKQQDIDIQEIEEIEAPMNGNAQIIDNRTYTINQLVQAVKQLDKNIKDKE